MLNFSNAQLITSLYVGYFGRAPETAGMDFWEAKLDAGANLVDIAAGFATSPEAIALYPELGGTITSASTFINAIYQNLFGRDAEPAGVSFWGDFLTNGGDVATFINTILTHAQGSDVVALANKVTVAQAYENLTELVGGWSVEQARSVIENVTDAPGSLNAGLDALRALAETEVVREVIREVVVEVPVTVDPTTTEAYYVERFADLDALYTSVAQGGGNAALFGNYSDPQFGKLAEFINKNFLKLGAEYTEYLANGNAIIETVVKQSATREQTLHDNLLGNITDGAINDRGLTGWVATEGLNFNGFNSRPYYDGNDSSLAAKYASVVFDYENNVTRGDYQNYKSTAEGVTIDSAGLKPNGDLLLGSGVDSDNFVITRDEVLGFEVGIRAREAYTTNDGVLSNGTYTVDAGESGERPGRADWQFDFSTIVGENGASGNFSDFDFRLFLDTDSGSDVNYVFLTNVEDLPDSVTSNPNVMQNSWNVGFAFLKSIIDDGNYNFEPGNFGIKIEVAHNTLGVVGVNEIFVDVV